LTSWGSETLVWPGRGTRRNSIQ